MASPVRRASTGSAVATPSRHLDFRGMSQDDQAPPERRVLRKRASDGGARVSFSSVVEDDEPPTPRRFGARRSRASSDDEAYSPPSSPASSQPAPSPSPPSPGTPKRRRKIIPWTRREESFIIQGVKKYGLGRWAQIRDDGEGIFHERRTNVDIKDKWKNLLRKVALTPQQEAMVNARIWRETVAARQISKMLPELLQQIENSRRESGAFDDEVDETDTAPESQDETALRGKQRRLSHGSEGIQFYIGTDASAPHLRAVTVVPRECPTITMLKRVLSRQLIDDDDAPLPTNLQLVSIHTRRLLGDHESVEECAERDGRELFLLCDP